LEIIVGNLNYFCRPLAKRLSLASGSRDGGYWEAAKDASGQAEVIQVF
jgi:hypothetical protein